MDSPLKVATPATAFAVRVPDSAPVPAGLGVPGVIDNVTALVSLVTVWPIESWIVTFGCVVKAEPPVAPAGEVVNASLLATPMTLSAALMAGVIVQPLAATLTPVSP